VTKYTTGNQFIKSFPFYRANNQKTEVEWKSHRGADISCRR